MALSRWSLGAAVRGLVLVAACVVAPAAYAHKVNVFAYLEDGHAYVQGYFLDGRKAKNSAVTVYSDNGERLVQGVTNEQGEFSFTMPAAASLRVVLNAGEGHQAEYVFTAAELASAVTAAESPGTAAAAAPEASPADRGVPAHADAQLRRAVTEAMAPLARELAELKERRTFSDIVGGLGFIVGILGVLAYLKARKLSAKER